MSDAADYWNPRLRPSEPRASVQSAVQIAACALLDTNPRYQGRTLRTIELAEALYPVAQARGNIGMDARQRLIKTLMEVAPRMPHYATRGKAIKRFGRIARPWLWHAAVYPKCPHCGKEITCLSG